MIEVKRYSENPDKYFASQRSAGEEGHVDRPAPRPFAAVAD